MNFPRAFFLSSLVLLISGGSQSISERLECTKSDVLGEQIISIELPSVSGGPSFKLLESEVQAFRQHCDEVSIFDLNLDETNQNRVFYNSKIRLEFGDGMTWDVLFGSTYTEATGALLVLEVEDGGFQGVDQFYTQIENFLKPDRRAKFQECLQELAENDPRNKNKTTKLKPESKSPE